MFVTKAHLEPCQASKLKLTIFEANYQLTINILTISK